MTVATCRCSILFILVTSARKRVATCLPRVESVEAVTTRRSVDAETAVDAGRRAYAAAAAAIVQIGIGVDLATIGSAAITISKARGAVGEPRCTIFH